MYIDKLDDIVHEYNNKYHKTLKMKPVDVKDNTYINFSKEFNDKDPKFKVGVYVRISKNIFVKGYTPSRSDKVKTQFPGHVIIDVNGEEIIEKFYEKELQKSNQKI